MMAKGKQANLADRLNDNIELYKKLLQVP